VRLSVPRRGGWRRVGSRQRAVWARPRRARKRRRRPARRVRDRV